LRSVRWSSGSARRSRSCIFTSKDDAGADLRQAIAEDTQVSRRGVADLDGSVLHGTPLRAWVAVRLLEEDGFEVPVIQWVPDRRPLPVGFRESERPGGIDSNGPTTPPNRPRPAYV
jgi:hypothetical protein